MQGPDPLIGRTVDRYQIISAIGDGGMARVYRAKHIYLHHECAVKVLHGDVVTRDPTLGKRFQREAQAASRIHHPNIVQIIDFGQTHDGLTFMAMELIHGVTLMDILRAEGSLEPDRAEDIVRQILEGLAAAHALGFVHRDLKPKNVMIANGGCVKILDFGLVMLTEPMTGDDAHLTKQGQVFGTPAYMAPEQVLGMGVDARSDIYAVGVILYQLLTGAVPFMGAAPQVAWHQVSTPVPPISGFDGLAAIAMRCLEKKPEKRPSTAAEVIALLDARLAGGVVLRGEPEVEIELPIATPVELTPPRAAVKQKEWPKPRRIEQPFSTLHSLPSLPSLDAPIADFAEIEDEAIGSEKRHRAWFGVFVATAAAVAIGAYVFFAPQSQPPRIELAEAPRAPAPTAAPMPVPDPEPAPALVPEVATPTRAEARPSEMKREDPPKREEPSARATPPARRASPPRPVEREREVREPAVEPELSPPEWESDGELDRAFEKLEKSAPSSGDEEDQSPDRSDEDRDEESSDTSTSSFSLQF